MTTSIAFDLKKLALPFAENEIEWRIGQAGKKGNGQVWAKCLAYVQARAIMNRLDDVCGPENWKTSYRTVPASQGMEAGVICELSIKINGEWVTKEDGAEQTDIESFKGGMSSALKRAGSVWGIGRYLYDLEEGWATITEQGRAGARYAKLKDGGDYYWAPPALPAWALPEGASVQPQAPRIVPPAPAIGDGVIPDVYVIDVGKKYRGWKLHQILEKEGRPAIEGYIKYFEDSERDSGKPMGAPAVRFVTEAKRFLLGVDLVNS